MKHLKQQLLMVLFVASGLMSFAQVGVGTTDPKASLDVSGDAATATSVDGIIAPRLTGDQLKAKDAVYTTDQNGAIVYVTAAVGTSTAKTINVTAAGYYYYDSTVPVWKSIGGGSASSAGLVANRVAISSITAGANGVYTVTDSNTPSAAGSPILATYEDAAGNVTSVNINNRTAGTSFDVTFAATPDAAGFLNYVFPTANVSVVTGTTGPAGPAGVAGPVLQVLQVQPVQPVQVQQVLPEPQVLQEQPDSRSMPGSRNSRGRYCIYISSRRHAHRFQLRHHSRCCVRLWVCSSLCIKRHTSNRWYQCRIYN